MEKEFYYLNIRIGAYTTEVEVNKFDFFNWIWELEEFTIIKEEKKEEFEKFIFREVNYYFINYYEEKQYLGRIVINEKKEEI